MKYGISGLRRSGIWVVPVDVDAPGAGFETVCDIRVRS